MAPRAVVPATVIAGTGPRCFVAAWPDDATRERLAALMNGLLAAGACGRAMRPDNLHLTLAFIGELAAARAHALAPAVAALAIAPFDWRVDALGHFRRARVVWAGGDAAPPLATAAQRVRALLDRTGVAYDVKPFVPHVTLLRDSLQAARPEAFAPIVYRATRVALYAAARDAHGPRYLEISALPGAAA